MASHPLENFEKTINQLDEYCSMPILNNRDKAGIIQAFEFTFEQSWLSIQKLLAQYNVRAPTPKQAYSAALLQGWIEVSDEPTWIKVIEDRNLTSHTYRQDIADEVLKRIIQIYLPMFQKLYKKLKIVKS